jgi:phospholipid/cholesterol/gamma-HCH transport system substrate-binding protein
MTRRNRPDRRRWWAVPALVVLAAATFASCGGGSTNQRTASATFSDIGDLANGAQVQMADVPVGTVSSIGLQGNRARVTLTFDSGVRIPADVSAAIARSTILGDQFVLLTVPKSETGAGAAGAPQLPNGARIAHTSVVPDVEQFIGAGSAVFGAITATELEQIIAAGGQGFTGSEASLKAFLTDITTVANTYANHTDQITQAINGLNSLSATLAPNSGANAQALTTLSQTVTILAKNSQQFETLLGSLNNVSLQGRSILDTYMPQITRQLQALEAVTGQIARHQADLAGILMELPLHNSALPSSVRNGYVNLYENIIVCGIPGGGADNTPAFTCAKNPNPGAITSNGKASTSK